MKAHLAGIILVPDDEVHPVGRERQPLLGRECCAFALRSEGDHSMSAVPDGNANDKTVCLVIVK